MIKKYISPAVGQMRIVIVVRLNEPIMVMCLVLRYDEIRLSIMHSCVINVGYCTVLTGY